jgi:hypothetical protein
MTLFHERQQFRQRWMWVLLLGVSLPVIALLAYGLYRQIVDRVPFGNRPISNAGLAAVSLFTFFTLVATLALMYWARLEVTVSDDGILIRFFPFHRHGRRIALRDVTEARARTYEPITEYGGWGIRYGFNGMAYNVSGHEGVQLVLVNGKSILIGSQRSEELEAAIMRALR